MLTYQGTNIEISELGKYEMRKTEDEDGYFSISVNGDGINDQRFSKTDDNRLVLEGRIF